MNYIYYVMPAVAVLLVALVGASAEAEAWRCDRAWERELAQYRARR